LGLAATLLRLFPFDLEEVVFTEVVLTDGDFAEPDFVELDFVEDDDEEAAFFFFFAAEEVDCAAAGRAACEIWAPTLVRSAAPKRNSRIRLIIVYPSLVGC
jgi:hypothetical protein